MDQEVKEKLAQLVKGNSEKIFAVQNLYITNYTIKEGEEIFFQPEHKYRVVFCYVSAATPESTSELTSFGFDILGFVIDGKNKLVVVNLGECELIDGIQDLLNQEE